MWDGVRGRGGEGEMGGQGDGETVGVVGVIVAKVRRKMPGGGTRWMVRDRCIGGLAITVLPHPKWQLSERAPSRPLAVGVGVKRS